MLSTARKMGMRWLAQLRSVLLFRSAVHLSEDVVESVLRAGDHFVRAEGFDDLDKLVVETAGNDPAGLVDFACTLGDQQRGLEVVGGDQEKSP